jgi:hypothetical protein
MSTAPKSQTNFGFRSHSLTSLVLVVLGTSSFGFNSLKPDPPAVSFAGHLFRHHLGNRDESAIISAFRPVDSTSLSARGRNQRRTWGSALCPTRCVDALWAGSRSRTMCTWWRDRRRGLFSQLVPVNLEEVFPVPWYRADRSAAISCPLHVAAMFRNLLIVHPGIAKSPFKGLSRGELNPGSERSSSVR